MKQCDQFINTICIKWPLPMLPAKPATALEHPVTIKMSTAIEQVPDLPPHPLDLCWQSDQHRLWIQVDCQALADLLSGRAALDGVAHRPIFIRLSRRLLKLYSMGFRPVCDSQEFVLWSPREYNTVAGHACNATMDSGRSSWYTWPQKCFARRQQSAAVCGWCPPWSYKRYTGLPHILFCQWYLSVAATGW